MVFITTSRGTEAVQLTSNMISSVLKVFPEKVDALHHLLRRPKQVGVCSGLWAGRTGVGAADARPAGVVTNGVSL